MLRRLKLRYFLFCKIQPIEKPVDVAGEESSQLMWFISSMA